MPVVTGATVSPRQAPRVLNRPVPSKSHLSLRNQQGRPLPAAGGRQSQRAEPGLNARRLPKVDALTNYGSAVYYGSRRRRFRLYSFIETQLFTRLVSEYLSE